MATKLRDFIDQREAEIRVELKALKVELRDLQVAKAALGAPTPPTGGIGAAVGNAPPTIKDMARDVLADQPDGLTSAEILAGIKKLFGRDIDRTSLSPQLSRLKTDEAVVLIGEKWFSKDYGDERNKQMFEDHAKASEIFASKMPEEPPEDTWDDSWGQRPTGPELEEEPPF